MCYFTHVVVDGITMETIKVHNFDRLFKPTFVCDDNCCDQFGDVGKCVVWRHVACTTHYFYRVSLSLCFAQCTHFKGCQCPNLNLMQQSTTRDTNLLSDGWTASCPVSAQKKQQVGWCTSWDAGHGMRFPNCSATVRQESNECLRHCSSCWIVPSCSHFHCYDLL